MNNLLLRDAGLKNGSRRFELLEDFALTVEGRDFLIPRGFVTDGASVPRIFWPIFPPFGPYFAAAVLHDYLYSAKITDRKTADKLFLTAMKDSGVGFLTRQTVYNAVRLGGWMAWN